MNKKQFIDALIIKLEQQNIRYPKWELTSIIEPTLEVIMETLSRGEEIQLNKFGRFCVKHKKGSAYYNINTKQKEKAPDKKLVQFIPHKGFRFFDDTSGISEPDIAAEDKQK